MSQATIDDNDHSQPPDDLATIFELVLAGYPVDSFIEGDNGTVEVLGCDYTVKIKNFSDGSRSVSLDTQPGSLGMDASISNATADIKLKPNGWCLWGTINGNVTIQSINISGDVSLSVVNAELDASLDNVSVTMNNLDFDLDSGVLDVLIGWLIDLFTEGLADDLAQSFEGEFANQLEPVLASALGSLAFDTSFELPSLTPGSPGVEVSLTTSFSDVDISDSGAAFYMKAGSSAIADPAYENLGALRRLGCGASAQSLQMPSTDPFEIGLSDDTFNLLLYAAWQGGLLDFEVPPEMLADVDLSQFGISPDDLSINLSAMLAPVVTDCAGGELTMHMGDLKVNAAMNLFGQVIDVEMYASFSAGVTLSVSEGTLGLEINEIQGLESQISVLQEALVESESAIAALIDDSLVPALLGALGGGALGGFPLPEIALTDEMLDLPAGSIPNGTAIGINAESSVHEDGNVYISGTLK